jgi:hypothetical protein
MGFQRKSGRNMIRKTGIKLTIYKNVKILIRILVGL